MSGRTEKINKQILRLFGEILQREADLPPDVLVTVSAVDTTPNLQRTTIWLYISPLERADEVLEQLKGQLYALQGALNRALAMRPLPRITLKLDRGAEHAQHINERLRELGSD